MQRFWDKVQKTETCWNWIAGDRGNGYGAFRFRKKVWDAHRVSWVLANGEIPDKLLVCHKCDNRRCVNPNHLFLGSFTDNLLDSFNKGRINFRKGKIFTTHGTLGMYNRHKCRCNSCRLVHAEYCKEWRLKHIAESSNW